MFSITRAVEHYHAGRLDLAAAALRQALRQQPKHPEANHLLAMVLIAQREFVQAEHFAQRAAALKPDSPDFLNTLGLVHYHRGRLDDAASALERAASLRPAWAAPWNNLGSIRMDQKRHADAADAWEAALRADPDHADSMQSYAMLLIHAGRTDRALPLLRRAAELDPHNPLTVGNIATAISYHAGASAQDILDAHRALARIIAAREPAVPLTPSTPDLAPDRRLTLGILSPDLREHSVTLFLEPLLSAIDPASFTLRLYSSSAVHDAVTDRLRARAASFDDINALTDAQAARLIRSHDVDILLDLAGRSQRNRLTIFRHRPAPVQATYLGYAATTGEPDADFRLVDAITDPPGTDAFASERLIRIDDCFLCFAPPLPPDQAPDPAPPPSTLHPAGAVTFGCFNMTMKISPPTVAAWARLLSSLPGSRLLLKAFGLDDRWVRSTFLSQFTGAGIDLDRVEVVPFTPTREAHLRVYHRVDVALDPFPYCGTTTTCEAIWMGLPVVTLRGSTHAARVGASLLHAVGHPEWIAADADEYVAIAKGLALDAPRRAALRSSLRAELAASPLGDAPAAARRFERALRAMWHEHLARYRPN
ncbi:MAG: tetratricopeptide repeat protein [Phycisphaerae bacterium]|nr:tetratricopeptide repeat protein [Phycisphaerae bacterium]